MNDAPSDPDVNQMMAVFDKLSRQADTAKDEMAMAVNSFVGRAQDIIIAKRAEIAQLRAQLAERDATIAALSAEIAEWKDKAYAVYQFHGSWAMGKITIDEVRAFIESRGATQ